MEYYAHTAVDAAGKPQKAGNTGDTRGLAHPPDDLLEDHPNQASKKAATFALGFDARTQAHLATRLMAGSFRPQTWVCETENHELRIMLKMVFDPLQSGMNFP